MHVEKYCTWKYFKNNKNYIYEFCPIWYFRNVTFVKNDFLEMWICEKWCFRNVNFAKIDVFKLWILWKMRSWSSNYEFLKNMWNFIGKLGKFLKWFFFSLNSSFFLGIFLDYEWTRFRAQRNWKTTRRPQRKEQKVVQPRKSFETLRRW